MRTTCLGGDPADRYFAFSVQSRDSVRSIDVIECLKINGLFGSGVVAIRPNARNLATAGQMA